MGLLSFLGKAAPGINAIAGGLNALDGLTGYSQNRALKKQFEYNSKLMDKQQDYSRENATTAYNRQIELTQMNPLLQTSGTRQAGHNVAMGGQGSSAVASVDSAASPSNPSVNAPDYQQGQRFADGMQQLLSSGFDFANKKYESEIIKANADMAKSDAEVREAQNELTLQRLENEATLGAFDVKHAKLYGDRKARAEANRAQSEADLADSRAAMGSIDVSHYSDRSAYELGNLQEQYEKLLNDNSLNPYYKIQLIAQIALLNQQTRSAKEQADYQDATHDLRVTGTNIQNYPFKFTDQFINRDLVKKNLSKILPPDLSDATKNDIEYLYIFYRQLGMDDAAVLDLINPGGWIGKASKEALKGAAELAKQIRKLFK